MYELTEKDKVLLKCIFEQEEKHVNCNDCILFNDCDDFYGEGKKLLIKMGVIEDK
jgi:hypothetical protein